MTEEEPPRSMGRLLDEVVEVAREEKVEVGTIVKALGLRSYGPLMVLTTLVEMVPPLSAVPGLYIVSAAVVILLSGQLFLLRPYPWLPERVQKLSISRERLLSWIERARPWARRVDKLLAPRLTFFLKPPFVQGIAAISIIMALMFFPLAFIPSSEKVLAAPVLFFGLALTANDGLLAAIGLLVTGTIIALPIVFWDQIMQMLPSFSSIADMMS